MSKHPPSTGSITQELERLGQTLGQAIKLAWESEERKRLEQDIAEGLRCLSEQLDAAVKSAAESTTAQDIATKASSAWETAHGPQILAEMRAGLAESLHKLNEELDRQVQQAKTQPKVEDKTQSG